MDNFILESSLKDLTLCDDIIEAFENNSKKYRGFFANGIIDLEHKDSWDLHLGELDNTLVVRYLDELDTILTEYKRRYIYSDIMQHTWKIESCNIQKYLPGGGFKKWHYEENGAYKNIQRHLVFMTYLNDVNEGGTDFLYQNKTVKAVKGKTVIWPAQWTHTHKGQVSNSQAKYITTGWYRYEDETKQIRKKSNPKD